MTNKDNKRLVEEYIQAWTKGDLKTLDRVLDNGFKMHEAPPGISRDKKGNIEMAKLYHDAFPDLKVEVVRLVSEGNDVAAWFRGTGTHKGEFMGVPASNKRTEVNVVGIVTIRNDKIVEEITEFDTLGLMTQIGAVPEMLPTH